MRALTLKAPWGTAVAQLGKDIENRPWRPPASILGQRIAIHQGAGLDRPGLAYLEEQFGAVEFEHGIVVCTAKILGWIDADGSQSESLSVSEAGKARRSPWYARQAVGWVLGEVQRPRAAVRVKGMLGLWTLPAQAADQL